MAGGVYCFPEEEEFDGYSILKVLAVEPGVVHVRIYDAQLTERPQHVDSSQLEGGIGHMPYDPGLFSELSASLLLEEDVTEEELAGYRYWLEDQGGVFS